MIPLLATVRIARNGRRTIRLWLPLILLWLLLLPLMLALVPLLLCLGAWKRINAVGALGAFIRILCSVRGTHIQVENPGASVWVRIR